MIACTLAPVTTKARTQAARDAAPLTLHLPERSWRPRADGFPGTSVRVVIDTVIPGADLYGGIIEVEPGITIPLHWHRRGELQFVLAGSGVLLHPDGSESPVGARSAIFSPAGRSGAHGFRNTGRRPLSILFFYPARGGRRPGLTRFRP